MQENNQKSFFVVTFDLGTEDLINELSNINPQQVEVVKRHDPDLFRKIKESRAEKIFLDGTFPMNSKLEEFIDECFIISHQFDFPLDIYSFRGEINFPGVVPIESMDEFREILQNKKTATEKV